MTSVPVSRAYKKLYNNLKRRSILQFWAILRSSPFFVHVPNLPWFSYIESSKTNINRHFHLDFYPN